MSSHPNSSTTEGADAASPAGLGNDAAAQYTFTLPGAPPKPGEPTKGVLMIHGLTGAPAEMRYLARQVNKYGPAVHAPLLAGHGADGAALLKTTWRDWLASMVEAYDRLAAEVDEVYVAGICVGGMLGVALAELRPQMKGLAVYSITFDHDGWTMPWWYRAGRPLKFLANMGWVARINVPEAPPFGIKNERLREMVQDSPNMGVEGALDCFPLGALQQQYALANHVIRTAPKVKVPTLILHAVEDDQAHARNPRRLQALMGGPVTLEWLNNSYHMIHVDQQRSEVARLTSEFFGLIPAKTV